MRVQLNADEWAYLATAAFVPSEVVRQITAMPVSRNESLMIDISEDEADTLRDALGEQLQKVGFDASYNPTPVGQILERLIDKFYVN